MLRMPLAAVAVVAALAACIADPTWAAAPPASVVAVANRDAEGAVVVDADASKNFLPTATACRDACVKTPGCNVWVWCGAVSGCSSGGGGNRDATKYQQCWLKYDVPPAGGGSVSGRFPRPKNAADQPSGWLSGTTAAGVADGTATPEQGYSCRCQPSYTNGAYRFEGVCAPVDEYSNPSCRVGPDCPSAPSNGIQSCSTYRPCTVLLDTDLQESKVILSGDSNAADSAEECCSQCAKTKGCNLWSWCSDSRGCGGELFRFRQCWLKQGDPGNPTPKKGFGGSPGWMSGVRMAYLPL